MKLEIEPIPNHSWGLSLANCLSRESWSVIRHSTFENAHYKCEICEEDDVSDLNCHELWKFDDAKLIQTLQGFECCCTLCHNVHHFGRSKVVYGISYANRLIRHWCDVNELTVEDFREYEQKLKALNQLRVSNKYKVMAFGREIK